MLLLFCSEVIVFCQTPDAPTNVKARPGIERVNVTFEAPANDGGSPITNYEYSTDDGNNWTAVSPASAHSPILITGLTNCQIYKIKVRAVNSAGPGAEAAALGHTATEVMPRPGVGPGEFFTIHGGPSPVWKSVTYGKGLFVAVSDDTTGNNVATSPNGINWTTRPTAFKNKWRSVTYGNGMFVAVANSGTGNRVMTSPDGINWTRETSAADKNWNSVTYGNGKFVAVANETGENIDKIMYSSNGSDWFLGNTPATNSNRWTAVTYGNGWFVAVGNGSNNNRVIRSMDGITWEQKAAPVRAGSWNTITYGDGRFVAVAFGGTIEEKAMVSVNNGATWALSNSMSNSGGWTGVTYGNGLFVAVSQNGIPKIMTSTDGISWTNKLNNGQNLYGVTYAANIFTLVGNLFYTSFDAVVGGPIEIGTVYSGTNNISISSYSGIYNTTLQIDNFEYSIDSGTLWIPRTPASKASPINITGLSPATTYQVMLRFVNPEGIGCSPSSARTVTTLNGPPDPPINLVATPNANAIIINFTPGANGGSPILNYEYTLDGGANWTAFNPAVTGTAAEIDSLSMGTEYTIQLRAVTSLGTSIASVPVTTTTLGPPAAPTNLVATPGITQIDLSFAPGDDGGSPILNYEYTLDGGANWIAFSPTVTGTPATINGLTTQTEYTIKLRALNTLGSGVASDPVTVTTLGVPAAPTNLVATPGGYQIEISFVAGDDGGSPITNYEYTLDGGANWTAFSPTVTGTPVTIGGLSTQTEYTIMLRAVNTIGPGPSSVPVTATTLSVPAAPTNLVATPGITQIGISFTPGSPGGSPITNYEYTLDGSNWIAVSSTNNSFLISNLSNCTTYNVMVRAVNSFGSGAASSAVTATPRNGVSGGITWTSQNTGPDKNLLWTSVTYGNDLFVAVGGSGAVMTSTDGSNWNLITVTNTNSWTSVTYGNGLFVAVALSGTDRAMTSTNGIDWNTHNVPATSNLRSVTYGNGLFVAVGNDGAVVTSPDGVTWTLQTAAAANNWRSVTYGNGLFVAVSIDGTNKVMTSPDGVTWTLQTAAEQSGWTSVTYGNGLFVAVAGGGMSSFRVMTSPNGVTWTPQTAAENNGWNSVTYGNGLFIAVSQNGTNQVMKSSNGTTWTSANEAAAVSWMSVTYGNELFVAVSNSGTNNRVMTSSALALLVPDKPVITDITPGNTTLSISFTPPGDEGGSAITNYQYSLNNGSTWSTRTPASTASPLFISGLTKGTTYQVQLRAVNTQGSGCESLTVSSTTLNTNFPDAPTSLVATACGNQVTISFTAGDPGATPITNYEYTLDGTMWTAFSPAVTSSPVTITQMPNGTFNISLRAVNSSGSGIASTTVSATINSNITVDYTGATIATATNKSAQVTLSASVTLPVGADVTQSKVRFINRNTGQPISGWEAITAGAQPNMGTAAYGPYTLTLGTNEIFRKYSIGFEVGNTGCYTRNSPADNVFLTLADPGCGCY